MKPRRVIVSLEIETDARVQELKNADIWYWVNKLLGADCFEIMEKPKVTVVGKVK